MAAAASAPPARTQQQQQGRHRHSGSGSNGSSHSAQNQQRQRYRQQQPQQRHTKQQRPPSPAGQLATQATELLLRGDLEACLAQLQQVTEEAGGPLASLLTPADHRLLLARCLDAGRADLAIGYVRLLPPGERGARAWTTLASEANRRRDLAALREVLAARRAAGLPDDAFSASALVAGLGAAGRAPEALAAFRAAWDAPGGGARSLEVANAALGAAARAGDWAAAQAVLAELRREGLDPDVVTHNSLIKCAGAAGLLPEVRAAWDELRADGLRPSPVTFSCLFSAAARADCRDAHWLLSTYDDMSAEHGVQPNDIILSALFSALSRATCTGAPATCAAARSSAGLDLQSSPKAACSRGPGCRRSNAAPPSLAPPLPPSPPALPFFWQACSWSARWASWRWRARAAGWAPPPQRTATPRCSRC